MKRLFYILFAVCYNMFRIFPTMNKTLFIMTHDKDLNGNIGHVYREVCKTCKTAKCYFIKKSDYSIKLNNIVKGLWKGVIVNSYQLATSKYIFLDNVFLPMAYLKFSKKVKIIQLWHGCGAVKKFGQDVNVGYVATLEKKANQKYTHVIACSESVVNIYESAFGVRRSVIYPIGSPRTDYFLNTPLQHERIKVFFSTYPQLIEKKIILYAPTFRDYSVEKPSIELDLALLQQELGQEYILLIRVHPYVESFFDLNSNDFAINVSEYSDLNTLLLVTDILITDYSSIFYDFALLMKPILFYAYDLDDFKTNCRGLYHDYESYVPGKIVKSTQEIVDVIKEGFLQDNTLEKFVKDNFDHTDGQSSKRVVDLIYN